MSELPVNILIPVGVILAALVAGTFSFINLVLSKEQQVSQLRQKWIDALREDISKYIAALVSTEEIYSVMEKKHGDNLDFLSRTMETKDLHTEISTTYSNIMMRLNPDDKSEHQRSLRNRLIKTKSLAGQGEWNEATKMIDDVRDAAQKSLKEEWELVKRGEPSFVRSKKIALVVFIVAIAFGGLVMYKAFNTPSSISQPIKMDKEKDNKPSKQDVSGTPS